MGDLFYLYGILAIIIPIVLEIIGYKNSVDPPEEIITLEDLNKLITPSFMITLIYVCWVILGLFTPERIYFIELILLGILLVKTVQYLKHTKLTDGQQDIIIWSGFTIKSVIIILMLYHHFTC